MQGEGVCVRVSGTDTVEVCTYAVSAGHGLRLEHCAGAAWAAWLALLGGDLGHVQHGEGSVLHAALGHGLHVLIVPEQRNGTIVVHVQVLRVV